MDGKVNDRTVHVGATGYEDFTTSKDEKRNASYLARHKTSEDWTLGGVDTAGFWARWLLWNKPSITSYTIALRSMVKEGMGQHGSKTATST